MMLFLVKRIGNTGYDEYKGFVIRAKNKEEALDIASKKANCEFVEDFTEKNAVTVEKISNSGKSEIVLDSFRAG